MDSFLFMCDLICAEVNPHVTLRGSLEDAMIGHTKCYGQKHQAFFYYLSFDNCSYLSWVESLHEVRDEEYRTTTKNINELLFMCFSPTNNNNIMESKKRWFTFKQVQLLERNFKSENKLELEKKMQLAMELGLQWQQVTIWFQIICIRWKTK
jgi:hypothetical protein